MWNTSAPANVKCTILMMIRTSRPASQARRILILSRAWPHGLTRFAPVPARLAATQKTDHLRRGPLLAADNDQPNSKVKNSENAGRSNSKCRVTDPWREIHQSLLSADSTGGTAGIFLPAPCFLAGSSSMVDA